MASPIIVYERLSPRSAKKAPISLTLPLPPPKPGLGNPSSAPSIGKPSNSPVGLPDNGLLGRGDVGYEAVTGEDNEGDWEVVEEEWDLDDFDFEERFLLLRLGKRSWWTLGS